MVRPRRVLRAVVVMTIRRVVERQAQPDAPLRAVERGLRALGVAPGEAATLAAEAVAAAAIENPGS